MKRTLSDARSSAERDHPTDETDGRSVSQKLAPVGRAIGRSRLIVLLAVLAVLLVAFSLFLLGTIKAMTGVWHEWQNLFQGRINSTDLTVEFLEIVSLMLKAVIFYLIGVGLYSLFIAPLNLTIALGVESLTDLETKVISVVVVIMAVTFLEHFILWENPAETLQRGIALALVVAALVIFQTYNHRIREEQRTEGREEQARKEMVEQDREHQRNDSVREAKSDAPTDE